MTKPLRHTTLLLAALGAAAAVGLAAPSAHAAPAALQKSTSTCWRDVINDWIQHEPNVVGTYAISCYGQALQYLNSMPDVTGYSSAPDDIRRAMLAAIHQERGGPGGPGGGLGGGPGGGGGNGTNGGGGAGGGGGGNDLGGGGGHHSGFLGLGGASSATSIPLPLIVLGALAILLALAALATWLARRFQTRRPTPAPAVAKRR
ncbi:MAG TPA: hypothetical protein VFL60_07355 [Gaiellaceae bacterium]|nr:hypothetical protein [Gaiellaceae bacterium]